MVATIDAVCISENGKENIAPIMVTITLEEYRMHVVEHTRFLYENDRLRETITRLESELERYRAANGR